MNTINFPIYEELPNPYFLPNAEPEENKDPKEIEK
jgi:hypothetical protein